MGTLIHDLMARRDFRLHHATVLSNLHEGSESRETFVIFQIEMLLLYLYSLIKDSLAHIKIAWGEMMRWHFPIKLVVIHYLTLDDSVIQSSELISTLEMYYIAICRIGHFNLSSPVAWL